MAAYDENRGAPQYSANNGYVQRDGQQTNIQTYNGTPPQNNQPVSYGGMPNYGGGGGLSNFYGGGDRYGYDPYQASGISRSSQMRDNVQGNSALTTPKYGLQTQRNAQSYNNDLMARQGEYAALLNTALNGGPTGDMTLSQWIGAKRSQNAALKALDINAGIQKNLRDLGQSETDSQRDFDFRNRNLGVDYDLGLRRWDVDRYGAESSRMGTFANAMGSLGSEFRNNEMYAFRRPYIEQLAYNEAQSSNIGVDQARSNLTGTNLQNTGQNIQNMEARGQYAQNQDIRDANKQNNIATLTAKNTAGNLQGEMDKRDYEKQVGAMQTKVDADVAGDKDKKSAAEYSITGRNENLAAGVPQAQAKAAKTSADAVTSDAGYKIKVNDANIASNLPTLQSIRSATEAEAGTNAARWEKDHVGDVKDTQLKQLEANVAGTEAGTDHTKVQTLHSRLDYANGRTPNQIARDQADEAIRMNHEGSWWQQKQNGLNERQFDHQVSQDEFKNGFNVMQFENQREQQQHQNDYNNRVLDNQASNQDANHEIEREKMAMQGQQFRDSMEKGYLDMALRQNTVIGEQEAAAYQSNLKRNMDALEIAAGNEDALGPMFRNDPNGAKQSREQRLAMIHNAINSNAELLRKAGLPSDLGMMNPQQLQMSLQAIELAHQADSRSFWGGDKQAGGRSMVLPVAQGQFGYKNPQGGVSNLDVIAMEKAFGRPPTQQELSAFYQTQAGGR